MIRLLICGDRNWNDIDLIYSVLVGIASRIEVVIEGECRGADLLSAACAKKLGIKVLPHPANWQKHGRAAGPIRNSEMLKEQPTHTIAFHDDIENSRGTADMVRKSRNKKIPTCVVSHKNPKPPAGFFPW